MTPQKKQRLVFVIFALLCVGAFVAIVLSVFRDNLVFYYTPTELGQKVLTPQQVVRVGGYVEKGSLAFDPSGAGGTFRVTDFENTMVVHFTGVLPDLFREGQGVVAEGHLQGTHSLRATSVLAKHDETYKPPARGPRGKT